MTRRREKDGCEFCLGAKGGVAGNENLVNGVKVCDYCHVLILRVKGVVTGMAMDHVAENAARASAARSRPRGPKKGTGPIAENGGSSVIDRGVGLNDTARGVLSDGRIVEEIVR